MITHTWQAEQLPIELILDRAGDCDRLQARHTDDWASDPWKDIPPSFHGIRELLTNYAVRRVSKYVEIPEGDWSRILEGIDAYHAQLEEVRQAASALAREAYEELFIHGLYVTNAEPVTSQLPKRVISATCQLADEGLQLGSITLTATTTWPRSARVTVELQGTRLSGHVHDTHTSNLNVAPKISALLAPLVGSESAAEALAADAAIVLGRALADAEIDNWEARRRFPLLVALMTNN